MLVCSFLGPTDRAGASLGSPKPNCTTRRNWFFGKNVKTNLLWALVFSSIVIFCSSCKSSNKVNTGGTGIPSTSGAITIAVVPNPNSLQTGSGIQYTAVVTGDSTNAGVTWALLQHGVACTACGTLSNNTTTSVTYTPPASVLSIQVQLIATSKANTTITGSATITSLQAGSIGTPFTATVANDTLNEGVTWALTQNAAVCMATVCGALSNATKTTVTYTPPASVSSEIQVELIAVSNADATLVDAATIIVTPIPTITISVAPNPDTLQAGGAGVQFTATVTNSSAGVTWGLGCTACGTLSNNTTATVTYTPPRSVTSTTQVQLIATSIANAMITGTATITVNPGSVPGTVPRFLYSSNNLRYGRITIHSVNASTGQLRFDGFVLLDPGGGSVSNAVLSPAGNYLYAEDTVDGSAAGIYGFSIGSNGQLTPLSGGDALAAPSAICSNVAIITAASSKNTFLYSFCGTSVAVMPVNSDGTLGAPLSGTLNFGATQMVFDAAGRFAYLGTNSGVSAYAISPSTGTLTALNGGSPYAAGSSGSNVLLHRAIRRSDGGRNIAGNWTSAGGSGYRPAGPIPFCIESCGFDHFPIRHQ
jgi:hypothetical protein